MKKFIELPDGMLIRKSFINTVGRIGEACTLGVSDEDVHGFFVGPAVAVFKTEAEAREFREKLIKELEAE